jgi:hypothetical protein
VVVVVVFDDRPQTRFLVAEEHGLRTKSNPPNFPTFMLRFGSIFLHFEAVVSHEFHYKPLMFFFWFSVIAEFSEG